MLILSFSSTQVFFNAAFTEYKTASDYANYTKAKFLAQSGLEAGLHSINKLEKYGLFKSGSALPVPLDDTYPIFFQTEDLNRKLNVNSLVNYQGNEIQKINERQRTKLILLAEHLRISPDIWDGVVDWIDSDNVPEPYGYEKIQYESLEPPRRIRNSHIHSLEELLFIPGFTHKVLFTDLRTEDEKEEIDNLFALDEDEALISDEDFIFANNIMYQLSANPEESGELININSAPYLVLLSLSPDMTPEIVREILRARKKKDGNLKLEDLKELGVPDALVEQSDINNTGLITETNLYKITASAIVNKQQAQVAVTYDKKSNDIIDYTE